MLGSLTVYRRVLNERYFNPDFTPLNLSEPQVPRPKLPVLGHGLAGVMAGATVSFIAAPVEHVKARLQIQYAADKSKRIYKGPIDCVQKLVSLSTTIVSAYSD